MKFLILLLALFLFIIGMIGTIGGCSFFNLEMPRVTRIKPYDGEVSVPIDSNIYVYFSIPMNQILTENSFSVEDKYGKTVEGEFFWSNNMMLVFNPFQNFLYGMRYRTTIQSTSEAENGRNLFLNIEHFFVAGRQTSLDPFQIVEVLPHSDMVLVDPSQDFTIFFNQPVDLQEIFDKVNISPSIKFESTYGEASNQVILKTIENFDYQNRYTLTVERTLKNIWGHALEKEFNAHYPVGDDHTPPTLTAWGTGTVSNAAIGIPLVTGIEKRDFFYFRFSESIAYEMFKEGISFSENIGYVITPHGSGNIASSNYIVTPVHPLLPEKNYTIELGEQVMDQQNNILTSAPQVLRFKVDGPHSLRPKVIAYRLNNNVENTNFNDVITLPYQEDPDQEGTGYYQNLVFLFDRPLEPFSLFQNISVEKTFGTGESRTPYFQVDLIQSNDVQLDISNLAVDNIYRITLRGGEESGIYDIYTNHLKNNFQLLIQF